MDDEKLSGLISYDESGAMTVRREDGTPVLDLFDTEDRSRPSDAAPPRLPHAAGQAANWLDAAIEEFDGPERVRRTELVEQHDALMREMLPQIVADVTAFDAKNARRPTVRLRRAWRALRGKP